MNARSTALPANLMRLGAGVLGVTAVGVLLVQGSEAAFTASTSNDTNVVASGTVNLTDSDGSANGGTGTAMFNVSNLNGGQVVERCINVNYGGSLTADIRLHGVISGELAPGLSAKIDIGTGAAGGNSFSCAGFVAPADPAFSGTLAAFGTAHKTYATGIGGYDNATAQTTKSYRITMTVSNENTFQGKSAAMSFTWEAQGKDVLTTNN